MVSPDAREKVTGGNRRLHHKETIPTERKKKKRDRLSKLKLHPGIIKGCESACLLGLKKGRGRDGKGLVGGPVGRKRRSSPNPPCWRGEKRKRKGGRSANAYNEEGRCWRRGGHRAQKKEHLRASRRINCDSGFAEGRNKRALSRRSILKRRRERERGGRFPQRLQNRGRRKKGRRKKSKSFGSMRFLPPHRGKKEGLGFENPPKKYAEKGGERNPDHSTPGRKSSSA